MTWFEIRLEQGFTRAEFEHGLAPYTVATWSDYDLDGDPDLFIGAGPANGTPGPDFIYRNMMVETGLPDLVRVTEGPLATKNRDGQVFNWIDFDNDGDLDVYVTNWGGAGQGGLRDELYRNDSGELVEIATGNIVTDEQVPLGSTWGDFDNDGDLDAYVADGNAGGGRHEVAVELGDLPSGVYIYRLRAGDRVSERLMAVINQGRPSP